MSEFVCRDHGVGYEGVHGIGCAHANHEPECATCGEIEGVENECPNSRRSCGHHCNHVWTHGECDWCGAEFGDVDDPNYGLPQGGRP